MILKSILIQNLGSIAYFSKGLSHGLNIIYTTDREELLYAIRLIFNHKTTTPPSFSVGVDTRIEAGVLLEEKEYRVIASLDHGERLKLSCLDASGTDVTSEYLYLTCHTTEHDISDIFYGEDRLFPRLIKDKSLSNIKAFRRYLRDFLYNFEPELLRGGKDYEIFLKKNGRYAVRHRSNGSVTNALSESERVLFRYLCFLRTAEFWAGFEALRNMHGIKKPLLISGFLERLDESIDVSELLFRTEKLQRQTIVVNIP